MRIHIKGRDGQRLLFFYLVLVPDLTRTLVAHHAGADRCPWGTDFAKELAVCWFSNAPQDPVADAGGMLTHFFVYNLKFFLCIVLLKFLFEPSPEAGITGKPRHSTSHGSNTSYMIFFALTFPSRVTTLG